MAKNFKIGFPVLGNRVVPDYENQIKENSNCTGIFIETLVCDVQVTCLTADENDRSSISIKYVEDFSGKNTFSDVIERAEAYARKYCRDLGIGAE